MNTLLFLKFVYLVIILIICFIGGILPLNLKQYFKHNSQVVQSYANCLSAGILLGASLIHLLVEAEESAEPVRKSFDYYPLAHLICGVGFFVAFLLEKVLFSHSHHSHSHTDDDDEDLHHHRHHEEIELDSYKQTDADSENKEEEKTIELEEGKKKNFSFEPINILNHHHQKELKVGAWILFSVCALESFISGSAIGVSNKSSAALVLFLAIVTHIWAEAFALCAAFLKSSTESKKIYQYIGLFSLITPFGIILGILLQNILTGVLAAFITSILISFAAGIFLFIGAVEILVEEFEDLENRISKFSLVLLGFTFMAIVKVFFA